MTRFPCADIKTLACGGVENQRARGQPRNERLWIMTRQLTNTIASTLSSHMIALSPMPNDAPQVIALDSRIEARLQQKAEARVMAQERAGWPARLLVGWPSSEGTLKWARNTLPRNRAKMKCSSSNCVMPTFASHQRGITLHMKVRQVASSGGAEEEKRQRQLAMILHAVRASLGL